LGYEDARYYGDDFGKEIEVETARAYAKRFAARVEALAGEPIIVKGKAETAAHGYIPLAEASVVYEGTFPLAGRPELDEFNIAELTLLEEFPSDEFYLEPYSGWLVGVYRK